MTADRDALALAYRLHYSAIVRFLSGLLGSTADVEDVAQEAFLRLARPDAGVPPDRVRFWLIRVARNLALNELRRRRPVGALTETLRDASRDPEAALLSRDAAQRCMAALQTVPEEWRTMLLLRELEDMSYAEIANLLGVSIGKVKTDLFRARVRLRDALRRMQ